MADNKAQTVGLSEYRCPNCGSVLQALEGKRLLTCPACRLPQLVQYDNFLPRLFFNDKIGRRGALQALRQALAVKNIDRELARSVSGAHASLWWVPVYQTSGMMRSVSGPSNNQWKIGYFSFFYAAAESSPYGFEQLNPPSFRWPELPERPQPADMALLKKSGVLLLPQQEATAALDELHKKWHESGLKNPQLLSMRQTVVYFPFWVVNFSLAGKAYSLTVNGLNGSIFYGTLPTGRRHGANMAWSSLLVGAAIGLTPEFLAFMREISRSPWLTVFILWGCLLYLWGLSLRCDAKTYYQVSWRNGKVLDERRGPPNPLDQIIYFLRVYAKSKDDSF